MTPGGRGGTIERVSNLNDSGPGSLHDALEKSGPPIVVFDASGTVDLSSPIGITKPFVTIAGRTAPGDGFALRRYGLEIRTHDVVVRQIRLRTGAQADNNLRALLIRDAANVLIDHCSISWGPDENISLGGTTHDVTIQRCLIAEGLYDTGKLIGPHSSGIVTNPSVTNVSIHHNVFAHNDFRNPHMKAGFVDIRNNLVYDFGRFVAVLGKDPLGPPNGVEVNWVGNHVIAGGDSEPTRRSISVTIDPGVRVYTKDNIGPFRLSGTGDEWAVVDAAAALHQVGAPFPAPPVTPQQATAVMADVQNGSGSIINDPSEVGGWPVLQSTLPLSDSDGDGMPNDWEAAHGLNAADASDGPLDPDGNGYTNVEKYLNSLGNS